MGLEARDVLPYVAALLIFGWGWFSSQRRSEALDGEQDHWRQVLQAERDNAVRECRRWQRYAQEMDIAHARLWQEWQEWAETMKALLRRAGLKDGERVPLEPNKSSVRWPAPPNGGDK